MFYANSNLLRYSDAANCWTLLQRVLSQREHLSCSHWGLLFENTTLQLLVWAKDTIIWIHWCLSFHTTACYRLRAGRCLLKAVVQLCFPRSRVDEQFLPSFLHQNLQCLLLAGLHVGPWEADQHEGSACDPLVASEWGWLGLRLQEKIDVPGPGISLTPGSSSYTRVLHRAPSTLQGWVLHLPTFCWKGRLIQEKLGLVLLPSCGCPKEATTVTVSRLHMWYLPIQADITFL